MTIILLLACWMSRSLTDDHSQVTTGDIIGALRARHDSIHSFSVMMRIQVGERSPLTGTFLEYAVVNEVQMDFQLGRFRSHFYGQAYSPPTQYSKNKEYLERIDQTWVFDGERTRYYGRSPGLDPKGGESTRYVESARIYPKARPRWIILPESLVSSFYWADLPSFLEKYKGVVTEGGGSLVIVDCVKKHEVDDSDRTDYRTRLWFDSAKGFALVRGQSLVLREGDKEWMVMSECLLEDWKEVRQGLWLPGQWTDTHSWSDPGKPMTLDRRHVAELSYSDVNGDFDATTFKFEFPPGVTIVDSERGTTYKTGAITDKTIQADAKKALELRKAYEQTSNALKASQAAERSKQFWMTFGTVSGVVVMGMLVVAAIWLQRRRIRG